MTRQILIGPANQLQFGSFIEFQVQTLINGVVTSDKIVCFDANKLGVAYDLESPNIVVFHFNGTAITVSNADYDVFSNSGIIKTNPVDLAISVIADIAQYTT
jgi:hypothetical protein